MAQVEVRERPAGHDLGGDGGDRRADGFGHERHRATGTGVRLEDIDFLALYRELYVDQALDVQRPGQRHGLLGEAALHGGRQREGRQRAG